MGGVVSGLFNPISAIAGRLPVIGPIAGPVVGGIMGGPAGFASSLAGQALTGGYSGGGGSSGSGTTSSTPLYAKPNVSYGTNTYAANGNPINASQYFITGDRGVYNLLPALGAINTPIGGNVRLGQGNLKAGNSQLDRYFGANAYTPYEAYQDVRTQMANDPTALAAFNKLYSPTAYEVALQDKLTRGQTTPATPSPLAAFNTTNPFPQQYVNYGLNKEAVPGSNTYAPLSYNQLANYAYKNENPFFMPFQTTTGATATAFKPSASYLAADTSNPYLTKYQTAMTAQQAALEAAKQAEHINKNVPPVRPDTPSPRPVAPTNAFGIPPTKTVTPSPNTFGVPPTKTAPPSSNAFGIPTPRSGIAGLRRP